MRQLACRLRSASFIAASLFALGSAAGSAVAGDGYGYGDNGKPNIWIVTVGGWGTYGPKVDGGEERAVSGSPIVSIRREGAREWLSMPRDGFGVDMIETSNFRAGPVGNLRWVREENKLPGIGSKSFGPTEVSLEGGLFAEFWPANWLRTRAEVRHALIGGEGLVADLTADVVLRPTPRMTWAFGPRLTYADSDYMQTAFGINAVAAINSGLAAYSPGGGIKGYGVGSMIKYNWSEQWATMAYVEAERLTDRAADSPLIVDRGDRDQITFGLGFSYSFTHAR